MGKESTGDRVAKEGAVCVAPEGSGSRAGRGHLPVGPVGLMGLAGLMGLSVHGPQASVLLFHRG